MLPSLKSLSLSRQVFDRPTVTLDLACLEGMPNLEGLHVSGFLLGDAAGARIGQLTKLRQVTAGDISSLTDASLRQLTEARNLRFVAFYAGQGAENLSPAGLAALGRLTYLETLRFYGHTLPDRTPLRVTDESLAGWKTLGNLRTLCVESCRVGDRGLRAVGQLASLEKLQLIGQLNITDEGLAPLAALTNLQALVLHESKIDGSGLAALAGLEGLRLLSLKNTPINDQGLKEIAKFNALRALDISGTAVTDAGLAQLRNKLPELTRLNIAGTKITDRGFAAIAEHKNLRELNASNTALTVAFLARLLEANPELKVWTIDSGNPQFKERFNGVFEPIDVDTLNH